MVDKQIHSMVINVEHDQKVHVPTSTVYLTTFVLLEQERWFESELAFMTKLIKTGDIILDIGANYGLYTIRFASLVGNMGKVFAFEPTPDTATFLQRTVNDNGLNNVDIIPYALSSKCGISNFFVNDNSELNSLTANKKNSKSVTVSVQTLDSIKDEFEDTCVNFVKLDAEGEEANIIRGAEWFIKKHDPLFMFEFKHGSRINNELLEVFTAKNFKLLQLVPGLNALLPINVEDDFDDFQLNLFSCSEQRFETLKSEGLVIDSIVQQIELPDNFSETWRLVADPIYFPDLYLLVLKNSEQLNNHTDTLYMEAINTYFLSKKEEYSVNTRFSLLQHAYSLLQQVVTEPKRLEYFLSFARVALDLGYRSVCLQALKLIIDNIDILQQSQTILPFIPVYDEDFVYQIKSSIQDQMLLKVLEVYEKLRSFSSYFLGGENLQELEALIKFGSKDYEILRRYQLAKVRNNTAQISADFSPLLELNEKNLNPAIWKNIVSSYKNKKAAADDLQGRFREIMADPSNQNITRVEGAGTIKDDYIIMHNGLKVHVGDNSYYGRFSDILVLNKGVHEPQEERLFSEVLKYISPGSTMVELGAYWSFYSMWFNRDIDQAVNYMVEPEVKNLEIGKANFKLNNMKGDFTLSYVGNEGLKIDDFVKEKEIDTIDILHSDIQGYELQMLQGAEQVIKQGRIKFIFVSTHSQELHYACLKFLKQHDYIIIASADFDHETFCYDGIIVAKLKGIEGPEPIVFEVRDPQPTLSIHFQAES